MRRGPVLAGLLLLVMLLTRAPAHAQDKLHVLLDNSTEMPQAQIVDGKVLDGLTRDLGLQLGTRLKREVVFRVLPRKRVAQALLAGVEADLLCNYLPEWLPKGLQWSQPFIPDAELVISAASAPEPMAIADLADRPVGTINGFVYPSFERKLGARFRREDAPDAQANLRKLRAGRMQHAIIGRTTFEYLVRRGDFALQLHRPLEISSYKTQCALSPGSQVSLGELNQAISALQADGSLQRVLGAYR